MSRARRTPLEHKATAPRSIGCWVLTVSDTKTPETDTSGQLDPRRSWRTPAIAWSAPSIVRDEPKDVQRVSARRARPTRCRRCS